MNARCCELILLCYGASLTVKLILTVVYITLIKQQSTTIQCEIVDSGSTNTPPAAAGAFDSHGATNGI